MSKPATLEYEFVKSFPEHLEDGTIYVSMDYATAAHRCCCGCGEKVITPIAPKGWTLTFNGVSVSLCPSIGNWNFACRSHYWIKGNRVIWAEEWSQEKIDAIKAEALEEAMDSDREPASVVQDKETPISRSPEQKPAMTWWQRIKNWKWGRG